MVVEGCASPRSVLSQAHKSKSLEFLHSDCMAPQVANPQFWCQSKMWFVNNFKRTIVRKMKMKIQNNSKLQKKNKNEHENNHNSYKKRLMENQVFFHGHFFSVLSQTALVIRGREMDTPLCNKEQMVLRVPILEKNRHLLQCESSLIHFGFSRLLLMHFSI